MPHVRPDVSRFNYVMVGLIDRVGERQRVCVSSGHWSCAPMDRKSEMAVAVVCLVLMAGCLAVSAQGEAIQYAEHAWALHARMSWRCSTSSTNFQTFCNY